MRLILSMFISIVLATSCDEEEKAKGVSFGPDVGCVQGVLIDGITGDRVPVPTASNTTGVHVIVRNNLLSGSGMTAAESTDALLKGEYTVCGVPLENEFPIVAWVSGYQPFSGRISPIVSAVANNAGNSNGIQQPLRRPNPTDLANIRLYPVGAQAKDYAMTVVADGEPLAGALVYVKQVGTGTVSASGTFLAPRTERSIPLSATTDESGNVNFTGDTLVLGGNYEYTIIPPEGAAKYRSKTGTFAVGLVANTATDFPERIVVNLDRNVPTTALAVVSTSLDNRDFNSEGKLVIYFNREIEFAPETKDLISAALANNNTAQLETNNPGNGGPETCTVEISGNKMTLTPVYTTDPDATDDVNMEITYSGITVYSKSGATSEELSVGPFTVPYYK